MRHIEAFHKNSENSELTGGVFRPGENLQQKLLFIKPCKIYSCFPCLLFSLAVSVSAEGQDSQPLVLFSGFPPSVIHIRLDQETTGSIDFLFLYFFFQMDHTLKCK